MNTVLKSLAAALLALPFSCMAAQPAPVCTSPQQRVDEQGYVRIPRPAQADPDGRFLGLGAGRVLAKANPDQFCAYLGTAQFVGHSENTDGHARLIELARAAGDTATVSTIEALGPPPWKNPSCFGIERRAMRKYEAMRTDPMPKAWTAPGALYATPQALADYEGGEDYSFIQFVGMQDDGMAATIDLYKLGTDFTLPVYLVQGTEDLLTTQAVTQRYYDAIKAPVKKLVLVPRAGHDPNPPTVEAQTRLLKEEIRPRCQP